MAVKNFLEGIFSKKDKKPQSLSSHLTREQIVRIRYDVSLWRKAIEEAEAEWYPARVRMQQLYMDTVINGHVTSAMQKRKDLTLLKDFAFYKNENTVDEKLTQLFQEEWFSNLVSYILDAPFYGYSLISFGDMENFKFPNLELIRRQNVSPDKLLLHATQYGMTGVPFMEDPYKDWNLYVSTPSENGISKCGFGLLYKVALYEIYCRNILGYNGDYTEIFGQPLRHFKTNKTGEDLAKLEETAARQASAAWLVSDFEDEINYVDSAKGGGTGWQSYESLESRCEKKISKLILGHADAIDSTTGKLGSSDEIKDALKAVEVKDGKFVENYINSHLIPKLINLGFRIPPGVFFKYKNDKEREETRKKEDESNKACADVVKTLSDSGYEVDENYITERTGIPVTKKEAPATIPKMTPLVQNKIKQIYGGH